MAPPSVHLAIGASTLEAKDEESHKEIYEQLAQAVSSTYEAAGSGIVVDFHRHPDGWYTALPVMVGSLVAHQHFQARDTDVLVATIPKSGTTWIKALLYAAARRTEEDVLRELASHNAHQLVPSLETQVYRKYQIPDLGSLPAPRLFGTHVPAQSLPASVASSGCKVVYLSRDPKDCFVSLWHFMNMLTPMDMDEALGLFCDGVSLYGPFWEHVLSYWRWHVERPDQVLFLTYEELTADTLGQLRRLADFIGRPFTLEEQEAGVDKEIVEACAMKNMVKQEVNKTGTTEMTEIPMPNEIFFRRGVVGDWPNYLTPEMGRRVDEITRTKFEGSGLLLPKEI